MRDMGRFLDPPQYYSSPDLALLSFDLGVPPVPPNLTALHAAKAMVLGRTEEMVTFHVAAVDAQLQQAYWAMAAAVSLNRTLLLPQFLCFCA
mgnify:CR=1 FL=1